MSTYSRRLIGLTLVGIVACITAIALPPSSASAVSGSSFNPAAIIDDTTFFNSSTMNAGDIQNFLNAKTPVCDTNGGKPSGHSGYATRADWGRANDAPPPYTCLKTYSQAVSATATDAYCAGMSAGTKTAATIINDVAKACGINPQTLVVLLQKEQSLITDDWPWPKQYRSATGYGCPDTAACDSQYYGYFNQVYNAARQFKRYVMQPQSYSYAVGRTSYVQYNPNAGCGGKTITIQNRATAALYNYTPYQPNAAALNDVYSSGDGCSAYGNRNFWRMFNDWFGPTSGNGYVLAVSDNGGDLRQWVIYGGIKQYVPSAEIKRAWNLPDQPTTFNADYLASISTGPTLDRLFIVNGGSTYYFVDDGTRYRLPATESFATWNLGGKVISSVPGDLAITPADGGWLKPYIKVAGSSTTYMVDGSSGSQTVLRPYGSTAVFGAIEGEASTPLVITTELYSYLNVHVGTTLTNARFSSGGSDYMVADGTRYPLTGAATSVYPATAQSVAATTINRLGAGNSMTYLVKVPGTSTYYVIDNGTKRALADDYLADAWQSPGLRIMAMNASFVSLLPNGTGISTYTVDVSGTMYALNATKSQVASGLDAAWRAAVPPTTISASLLSYFPSNSQQLTRFFQEQGTPNVYMLDNSSTKHLVRDYETLSLWGGYIVGVPLVPSRMTNGLAQSPSPLGLYVNDGTSDYVMSKGKKLTVNATAKATWALTTAQVFSDGTLSSFSANGALANTFTGGGGYFIVKQGICYGTVDPAIGQAWSITNESNSDIILASALARGYAPLTRFVRSSAGADYTMYLVDKGIWHRLRWEHYLNLGGLGSPAMILASTASDTVDDWQSAIVKADNGKYYAIDGGGVRTFPAQMIIDQWSNWSSLSTTTVSDSYINQLPYRGIVERTIKGSGPSVYTVINGQKRHILYPDTYVRYYAPYNLVGDLLVNALPDGQPI